MFFDRPRDGLKIKEFTIAEFDFLLTLLYFQIFLTESNIHALDAIDEEEFEGISESPSRDVFEDIDEVEYKSRDTRGSNISSISEEVPDEDYDTDLEMDDSESENKQRDTIIFKSHNLT